MKRIFPSLAILNLAALSVLFTLGLVNKLRGAFDDDPAGATYEFHFLLALGTILLSLMVHSLIFVYFLGTGRYVKEIALAYRIADDPLPRRTRDLKRKVFPPALFGMLTAIATAAAGSAARNQVWPWQVHLGLAALTLAVNAWANKVEAHCVGQNNLVLDEVMREVDRIRAEHGLPSNAEALRQEAEQRG